MKQLTILLTILFLFSACKKEMPNSGPIEPPIEKIISIDTVTSGELYGLKIGGNAPLIYSEIQNIQPSEKGNYLGIVGNAYTSLSAIENKIPLYLSLLLDETVGTESGIQIYFSENKVKYIGTNGGTKLNSWPSSLTSDVYISVNDPIESIYSKLEAIKEISTYAKKFQRISIFEKDVTKAYDVNMSSSKEWNFNFMSDQKSVTRLTLNFQNQQLISIYSTVVEIPNL